jgi:hypothetical protein
MQVRFTSSLLPRYSTTACTCDHLKAKFSLLSALDSPRRCFRAIGAMEPQTAPDSSTPTATVTSVSYLLDYWQESLHPTLPSESQNAVRPQSSNAEPLVMQIVVRRDLFDVSLR